MKIILLLPLLLGSLHAATVNAASCSTANVNSAISAASSGDTVLLPGGTCTWSSTITIDATKPLTLDGGGAIITGQVQINPHSSINSRVTNFTFHSGIAVQTGGDTTTAAFRIDHSTFDSGDVSIRCFGNADGLIDHNTFTSVSSPNEIIHNEALGASDASGWTDSVTPGGPHMLFIEDNTFFFDIVAFNAMPPNYFWGSSALQSYYGARTVFRHNLVQNMQVDAHGTPGSIGARWWEIYENTFFTGPNSAQSNYMSLRGGSGVAFNNHHTGTNGVTGAIALFEEDSGYPALYQIGRGINQNLSPAYLWNNDSDMSTGSNSANVTQGVDFFVSATTQPTNLVRWELTTDNGSTTYNYVPYTYPHPLQSGGALTAPGITSSCPLTSGTQNSAYFLSLTANGNPVPTWDLSTGSMPTGLSLATNGVITGTPTTLGSTSFTLRATNSQGNDTLSCSMTIAAGVAIDAISQPADNGGAASSLSWTHVTGSLANRYMVIGISGWNATGLVAPTGCTYNGVALTSLGSTGATGDDQVSLWGLVAPASGSHTAACTFSGTISELGGGAITFSAVNQTTPHGTYVGSSTTSSVNVTLSAGDLAVDILYMNAGSPTVGAGQSIQVNHQNPSARYHYMSTEVNSGTTTMSWTGGSDVALAAIPIKLASGSPSDAPMVLSGKVVTGGALVIH